MISKDGVLTHGLERAEKRPRMLLGVLAAAVLGSLLAGMLVRSANVLPGWVPVIGMDSGVAMCKAIAEKPQGESAAEAAGSDEAVEMERVRQFRALFAGSRYDDIRVNGVALMDLTAQFVQMSQGRAEADFGTSLALVGPMMTANAGLAGGCREHGYEIPSMQP